jgi:HD-like signal output (HDOD) protein
MAQERKSLQEWVAFFTQAELPVLKHTARELERLHADEDHLNARSIAAVVTSDPMMTVKLLRHVQAHKRSSQTQELVQVEQAIMMMGFGTFFRAVKPEPLAEDVLHGHLPALTNLLRTVRRGQRASRYAFDWALLLHDLHAEEVRIAALLSYLSEMLMWCFNPDAMLQIHDMQVADKTLRSAAVQEQVLGFKGIELQKALTEEWKLPELLMTLMDGDKAQNTRVRNVMLALNLARHSANGWDDAALPDDYRDIAALLRIEPEKVMAMVGANPAPSTAG